MTSLIFGIFCLVVLVIVGLIAIYLGKRASFRSN